jgi:membrane-associated phospholipid phosphatase
MPSNRELNRRNFLKLGVVGGAAANHIWGSAGAHARDQLDRAMNLGADGEASASFGRPQNAVLFWNDVALQLVGLDHSIDARDARAPGPCATARALGLVHIVMADAVAAVYPTDYLGLFVRDRIVHPAEPDAFVAGAAAWILEYIFSSPAHAHLIGQQRLRFLSRFEPEALKSWESGLAFARNDAFTKHWDWLAVRSAILTRPTTYVPEPRGHSVDPFNVDQGFYGVGWGQFQPLDPSFGDPAHFVPGPPPDEGDSEYRNDYAEVREIGAYRPDRVTEAQIRSGLFWAYDGARLIGAAPRLFNQIVRQILLDDEMSVTETARCLALCNLAMADGSIVAWEAKYRYAVWRPVVAIRQLEPAWEWRPYGSPRSNPTQFALGPDTQLRATAQSFMGATASGGLPPPKSLALAYRLAAFTPNFPAYPSGHATMGTACLATLRYVRGERAKTRAHPNRVNPRIDFVSDELNGVTIDNFVNRPRPYLPQHFTTIDEMIQDNLRSRVHLGVHWSFDGTHGASSGVRIAERIYSNAYRRVRNLRPLAEATGRRRR